MQPKGVEPDPTLLPHSRSIATAIKAVPTVVVEKEVKEEKEEEEEKEEKEGKVTHSLEYAGRPAVAPLPTYVETAHTRTDSWRTGPEPVVEVLGADIRSSGT